MSIILKKLVNYDSTRSVGSKLRAKRIIPLLKIIESIFYKKGNVNIIDVGGTDTYWNIVPHEFLEKHNVEITIVNLLGTNLSYHSSIFTFVQSDGCRLSEFNKNSFDIAHSNSVIEHVGDWNQVVNFSRELKRVARGYYIQTPSYWFPIEPHFMTLFFHWLPKSVQIFLVMNFSLGNRRKAKEKNDALKLIDNINLLDKEKFQSLFDDAQITTERWLGFPKSYIAIREY